MIRPMYTLKCHKLNWIQRYINAIIYRHKLLLFDNKTAHIVNYFRLMSYTIDRIDIASMGQTGIDVTSIGRGYTTYLSDQIAILSKLKIIS